MTNEEIVDMALEAAQSAFDAHYGSGALPPGNVAYDFIRNMRFESFEGSEEDASKLWESMEFSADDHQVFNYAYYKRMCELAEAAEVQA